MGLNAVVYRKREHLQLGPDEEHAKLIRETGEVYFEDLKLDRKSNGQYYTPELTPVISFPSGISINCRRSSARPLFTSDAGVRKRVRRAHSGRERRRQSHRFRMRLALERKPRAKSDQRAGGRVSKRWNWVAHTSGLRVGLLVFPHTSTSHTTVAIPPTPSTLLFRVGILAI